MVSAKIVEKAAQEVLGDFTEKEHPPRPKQLWGKLILATLVAFLCANGVLYYLNTRESVVSSINSQVIEEKVLDIATKKTIQAVAPEETEAVEPEGRKATIKIIPLEISD